MDLRHSSGEDIARSRFFLSRPGRLARSLYRLPIALHRWRLGWLLGRRFLLLAHRGRSSGQMRATVLEVVRHDETRDAYIVVAAFGARSDWFLNLRATPAARVQVGLISVRSEEHTSELQ